MKLAQTAKAAVLSVLANKTRTALTMLGLVIGISSVILLVGIGDGSSRQVEQRMKSLGGDALSAFVFDGNVSYADMDGIRSLPSVRQTAPSKPVAGEVAAGTRRSSRASVEASDENYLDVRNLKLAAGRNLSPVDRDNKSKVAVVGAEVAQDLFGSGQAVGRTFKISGNEFAVVGVLAAQGQSMGLYTDGLALIPFPTAASLGADQKIETVYARPNDPEDVDAAKQELVSYLARTAGLPASRFDVASQTELLSAGAEVGGTLALLLGGIAGISLVVAGIGVMNVMLVSVTERVREIGIKKALGATRADILLQFLVEALVLSLLGGAAGIAAGIGLGTLANGAGLPFAASGGIVAVSAAASTAIGLAFGIFPAYRASRLNPIEALRQD